MKKYLLSFILIGSLVSCKKETPEATENAGPQIIAATVVLDPVNYAPGVTKVLTNAIQLNYGAIKVGKSMNLALASITPDIMANYSVHIYLKSGGKYYHLPALSPMGISYTYTLKAAFPFCNTTVTRPPGVPEMFDDVIVVAAKNSYLLAMTPSLNFSDYNAVKIKLGL